MIRVALPPPSANYVAQVKVLGEAFLRRTPNPTNAEWKNHNFWRAIHDDLYAAHAGVCVYCASWTPRRSSAPHIDKTSIDHYIPKSVDPIQAYAWANFRLCRSRLNHRKANFRDVLDPCKISDDWFFLDFATFRIEASTAGLASQTKSRVKATISRLQLNSDPDYVNERIGVIRGYSLDRIAMAQVLARWPFIARQMRAQQFDTIYKPRLRTYFLRVP
jgi:hypothetical protein